MFISEFYLPGWQNFFSLCCLHYWLPSVDHAVHAFYPVMFSFLITPTLPVCLKHLAIAFFSISFLNTYYILCLNVVCIHSLYKQICGDATMNGQIINWVQRIPTAPCSINTAKSLTTKSRNLWLIDFIKCICFLVCFSIFR